MPYYPGNTLHNDPAIYPARVKYAAFLYDAWKDSHGRNKALVMACKEAGVSLSALRQALPAHHRRERIIRNWTILKMRSWGYSIDLIAESMDLHRMTVSKIIDDFKTRLNAHEKVKKYKIRGRLRYGDPRMNGLPVPVPKSFLPAQTPEPLQEPPAAPWSGRQGDQPQGFSSVP